MGVELFHADRQTDMTKLIFAFRTFADAPKNAHGLGSLTAVTSSLVTAVVVAEIWEIFCHVRILGSFF